MSKVLIVLMISLDFAVLIALWLIEKRLTVIASTIELLENHVDYHAKAAQDERKGLTDAIKTNSGRLQWLVANKIAEEVALYRVHVEGRHDDPGA